MQARAEPDFSSSALCNLFQILYQFLGFTQNLKRSLLCGIFLIIGISLNAFFIEAICLIGQRACAGYPFQNT